MKKMFSLIAVMLVGCSSLPASNSTNVNHSSNISSEISETLLSHGKFYSLPEEEIIREHVTLNFQLAYGNSARTMTYNKEEPITLSDGTVISSGMLKPVWAYIGDTFNATFVDMTVQNMSSEEMITTAALDEFNSSNIYGGSSIGDDLMYYGAQGHFVNLSEYIDNGSMPNFSFYLYTNPAVRSAITAYDGNIYYIPYIAEIGTPAREYIVREDWPIILLDNNQVAYDTDTVITTYYEGFYIDSNARTGSNGGVVEPKAGTSITKSSGENIIQIMNELPVKNGYTLATTLIEYINRNYSYQNPSELYIGSMAAYDIDELIALFRVIKANPLLLSNGLAMEVWPFFARQSSYREDVFRFSTYFDGTKAHGTDSYYARLCFNENGELFYTYGAEDFYEVITYLGDLYAEGLLYTETFNTSNTSNHRSALYGTDNSDTPSFGYMTFDWIASSTNPALNSNTTAVLPPVANVNGVWQYYVDNTRSVKPDGWAIAKHTADDELDRAIELFDFYFSEEGSLCQNYGLPMDIVSNQRYIGPDGYGYPTISEWVQSTSLELASGDVSTFLRDWMGSLMPIGYQKEIGAEYQTTSANGIKSWEIMNNSKINYPSYGFGGPAGDNSYYYDLTPTLFSLTDRQITEISANTTIDDANTVEFIFNTLLYSANRNAPAGIPVAYSLEEYTAYFANAGITLYEEIYNAAYKAMSR
ncbi:MAG: hypothetical protein BEN19_02285 [Epulopiscium sp. Nuni2H_MBin003]|nr:MAG: hypothetical protein BEN19_02285 [Epulopiscium sp. Nuni2H_MBin003]